MRLSRILTAVDSHTGGESTRIVSGIPHLPGETLIAQRDYLQENLDWIRTVLTWEPRSVGGVTALLVPPTRPGANLGVIFLHSSGYPEMCGHATIGLVVVAAHLGLLELREPITRLLLDTPAGAVAARASVRDGKIESVTIRNVPAYALDLGLEIDVPDLGRLAAQIAYGGNFYALVDGEQIRRHGCDIDRLTVDELIALGNRIAQAASTRVILQNPVGKTISRLEGVLIALPPTQARAHVRSIAISRTSVDRSPCGTGLSARMAMLYAQRRLALGERFVQEGLVGSCFTGVLVEEIPMGDVRAVVPEVTGMAYITGFYQAVLDEDDPHASGFQIGRLGVAHDEGGQRANSNESGNQGDRCLPAGL